MIVLDIYGSARETAGGVSSADLVALGESLSSRAGSAHSDSEAVIETPRESLGPDDLVVTLARAMWRVGTGVFS